MSISAPSSIGSKVDHPAPKLVVRGTLLYLLIFQVIYLVTLGNSLGEYTDSHSEADSVRAAEAYFKDGLTSHYGLPRILYGNRYPGEGTIKDHLDGSGRVVEHYRRGFPPEQADPNEWAYTHYPPGPIWILAIVAKPFGLEPMGLLRIFPVATGLFALGYLFRTVTKVFGSIPGAVVAVAFVMPPTVPLVMPSLHYQSYSLSLLCVQMVILIRWFWLDAKPKGISMIFLFLIGFVQGWMSFDFCFLVSLLALPFWLLRRAEKSAPPMPWLFVGVVLPGFGFALAHVLHFAQVAADLGGFSGALAEFRNTASERGGLSHGSYIGFVANSVRYYLRLLNPKNAVFGPFLVAIPALAAMVILFVRSKWTVLPRSGDKVYRLNLEWPWPRSVIPPLVAALFVSIAWLLAMPQHVFGNFHLTYRHALIFYFFCTLAVGISLSFSRRESSMPRN